MCKPCFNAKEAANRRERRANDPEFHALVLERNKAYRDRYSDGYRAHQLRKRSKEKSAYFGDLRIRCKHLCNSLKTRALKKGFDFDLTWQTLYVMIECQYMKCSVTGIDLDIAASDKYSRNPLAPSIDRKNNDKGYTIDNVQVVCAWYNLMKNEWSDEDMRSFVYVAYHTMFGD